MAQIGIFLVLGVVISIMAVSMYMYVETSSSIVEINSPDKVAIGPVEYTVSFGNTSGKQGNKARKYVRTDTNHRRKYWG